MKPEVVIACISLAGTVITSVMAWLIHQKQSAIHILVNSNYGIQLEHIAALTKREADRTKDPTDVKEAERAAQRLKIHNGQQAVVDGKLPPKTEPPSGI